MSIEASARRNQSSALRPARTVPRRSIPSKAILVVYPLALSTSRVMRSDLRVTAGPGSEEQHVSKSRTGVRLLAQQSSPAVVSFQVTAARPAVAVARSGMASCSMVRWWFLERRGRKRSELLLASLVDQSRSIFSPRGGRLAGNSGPLVHIPLRRLYSRESSFHLDRFAVLKGHVTLWMRCHRLHTLPRGHASERHRETLQLWRAWTPEIMARSYAETDDGGR
jgi:hypothetical protein